MAISRDLGRPSAATTYTFVHHGAAPARPAWVRLRSSFWATSRLRNPELRVGRDRLELHVPATHHRVVHRVRYDRIRHVEFVEGRRFTDVIIRTVGGLELVAPGIRNAALVAAKPYLSGRACTPS